MKKFKLFLLCFGIFCIIIGFIGSIHYFPKISDITTKTSNEHYSIADNSSIHSLQLTVSGNVAIYICQTDAAQLELVTENIETNPITSTWTVTESEDKLAVSIIGTDNHDDLTALTTDFLDLNHKSSITLYLPK